MIKRVYEKGGISSITDSKIAKTLEFTMKNLIS
jgi:hypothetical protein